MKKILLLVLVAPLFIYGQGEQRYADGTATDQNGNTFEWIKYGTQDWAIENAEVMTYRDGTEIPYVEDATAWENLTTGAWCYYDNDPSKGKLYNMFAVLGRHDDNQQTPDKVFAPIGWQVPTTGNWDDLIKYVSNTYSIPDYWIGQSLAATSGWLDLGENFTENSIGINQETNNISGFNIYPFGQRHKDNNSSEPIKFSLFSFGAYFWTSNNGSIALGYSMRFFTTGGSGMYFAGRHPRNGFSVRFLRDATTASVNNYSKSITIYPNPTTSIVTLKGEKQYDIKVYTLLGKQVMALSGNTIDMSHLSPAIYIVKVVDKTNNKEESYKILKKK